MPAHVLGWGGDEPTASWVRGVALMDRRVARRVDVAEGDAAGEANLDVRDGSSEAVDRPAVRRVSRRHPDDDGDTELSQPVPNSDQLVAEAVTLAAAEIEQDPQLCELVAHYWRLVPDEELVGRTPEEMLVATVSHRELAAQRLPGELKLRVGETLDGYHTAVEIVTDDMPFLVDSVTGALAGELDIHLLVHPVVVMRREVFGALEEVRLGVEPDEADFLQRAEHLAAHHDHRVDEQMDVQLPGQRAGDRVDEERHVVGDDLHGRVVAVEGLPDP